MKVTVGAYSLDLLPKERLELLLLYKVPNKTTIHTDCVINCAGACGGIVLKCPHQIVTCELIILVLYCACSLQMYKFLAGNGQQKQTYKIWTPSVQKKLVTKYLCFPAIAICCNVHQVYVGEYGPGEALHVDADLTTVHTLVRVSVHPQNQLTLQVCHKKYKKQFTCTLVEHVAVIPGTSPNP